MNFTNLFIGYNQDEDFRILIRADNEEEALSVAKDYGYDAKLGGDWDITEAESQLESARFDCDYVLSADDKTEIDNDIYPLTVIKDRYNGIYSGGRYTAWNLDHDEIPEEIFWGDIACLSFWQNNSKYTVGFGNTMKDAVNNLAKKLYDKNKEVEKGAVNNYA